MSLVTKEKLYLSNTTVTITLSHIYSDWSETFAVPDKKALTVTHLFENFFSRCELPLQLVTDKEQEIKNEMMRKMFEELNMPHINTSFCHFLSNGTIYQPSARAGYDTRSIFKRSLTGLNSEFFLLLD